MLIYYYIKAVGYIFIFFIVDLKTGVLLNHKNNNYCLWRCYILLLTLHKINKSLID